MTALFFWLFLVLTAIGVPVFFVLLMAPTISLLIDGQSGMLTQVISRLFNGMFSFPLMAIPLFLLAGECMNNGGITLRLVNFAQTLIGHIRGGLAQVNIFTSVLFAGLSGSAVADASALGSMLIPAMEKNGYSRRFAAAVTAASAVIGPIIPPSIIMIIYAFIMQVSPAALFAAGIIPGLIIAASLMLVTAVIARKRQLPVMETKATGAERIQAARHAVLPLLTPVILLGGILGGIFTPTEAAGVAAFYAFFISLFVIKTMTWRDLPGVFKRAAVSSAVIMVVIGASVSFAWLATVSGIPQEFAAWILDLTGSVLLLLLLLNILLFAVGMILDAGPAILILGPILSPVFVNQLGMDPLHFAIIMCVNVTVGLITPPMGLVLFVTSNVSRERLELILRELFPYLAVEILIILLITYVPAISLTLPRLLNFI
ncbi:TRAP transporter large permease [Aliamphritea hakodatensis]|uniref:TRAP transporter large permease n=1 Tax=Aliamphritea hakodatensis TaxID=2895352 RepID=UPI0022FD4C67|nr:TRAP transporter large permease [Aliamphritea hakodatensis]